MFFFKKLAFEKKLHIIIAVKIFGNPIFEKKDFVSFTDPAPNFI